MQKKSKLYKCQNPNCGRMVAVRSKGLCTGCRQIQRQQSGELEKKTYVIPKTSKRKKVGGRKKRSGCLTIYFQTHLQILERERKSITGNPISSPSTKNIAHLLPKRSFKDIQCHLDNCIYLTWQEHSNFDNWMDSHQFNKLENFFKESWEEICIRLEKIISLTQERNKHYWTVLKYLENRNKQ